jgi:tetratricopeptide (TPR) repeat protein
VHIISAEKYAELRRNESTLEEFSSRYTALREALEAARKSLAELEKAAETNDTATTHTARNAALEAHREAGKIFSQIAKDFPLFDLDASLAEASGEAVQQLMDNVTDLEELKNSLPVDVMNALPQLRERLGKGGQRMAGEMQRGERAMAAAEVFEQAGRFRDSIDAQRALVKEYNRVLEQIRRGETQAGQALRDLAGQQAAIAGGLRELQTGLDAALKALPEEFSAMTEEGRAFLDALAEMEIGATMDEGAAAAEKGDGRTAGNRAGEALAKLEALLRKKNGFCAMCRGEAEGSRFPWPQDLSQTPRTADAGVDSQARSRRRR